eukprot:jgi/Ulvmu1/7564/UM037_0108.1
MKQKRARTHDADLPASEVERRRIQRERQKVAYAMRAQGSAYVKAAITQKAPAAKAQNKDTQGSKARVLSCPPFQVAIIAIFWNQRRLEKKLVLHKCEQVASILQRESITCHVDCSGKFTPGQRMRHWEEKGVRVRIELGPRDAEQNTCIVARSQAIAGRVAHKRTSEIGTETCDLVREMLKMPDSAVPEGSIKKYEARKQVPVEKHEPPNTQRRNHPPKATSDENPVIGGDDLDDDFDAIQ